MNSPLSDLPNEPDWKRAFAEAAESPPPRVWDAIDRRLDAERKPKGFIIPLWAGSARLGWWASGVAASLILTLGLAGYLLRPSAQTTSASAPPPTPDASAVASARPVPAAGSGPVLSDDANAGLVTKTRQSGNLSTNDVDKSIKTRHFVDKLSQNLIKPQYNLRNPSSSRTPGPIEPTVNQPTIARQPAMERLAFIKNQQANLLTRQLIETPDLLAHRPARFADQPLRRAIAPVAPLAMAPASANPTAVAAARRPVRHDHWVAASVLGGGFSPNIALAEQLTKSVTANFAPQALNSASTNPSIQNQAQASVGVQLSAGLQLAKHWLAEIGITYVQGRSAVLSSVRTLPPAYDLSLPPGLSIGTATRYTDAVRANIASNQPASAMMTSDKLVAPGVYYDPNRQRSVANEYAFVQLPVQVGYQFRPRRKLGIAVLGGLIANIFVRNRVDNRLEIRPSDGLYDALAWAGGGSVRLRYQTGKHWSATVAGVYQRALSPATRPGAEISSRPEMLGLTMGLDCHF